MLTESSLRVWIAWIGATAFSGSFALALSAYFVHLQLCDSCFGSSADLSGDNLLPHYLVWSVTLLIVAGPLMGLSQGLVLLVGAKYKNWFAWAGASALGIFVAMITLGVLALSVGLLGAILAGFVLGLAQLLVLRHSTEYAFLWVLVSGIGWVIAATVGFWVATSLLPPAWRGLPFYPTESVIYLVLTCLIVLTIYGSITGAVLLNPFSALATKRTRA